MSSCVAVRSGASLPYPTQTFRIPGVVAKVGPACRAGPRGGAGQRIFAQVPSGRRYLLRFLSLAASLNWPMRGFVPAARQVSALFFVGLVLCSEIGWSQTGPEVTPANTLNSPAAGRENLPARNLAPAGRHTIHPGRKFVRKWKVNDLTRELHRLGQGRSYKSGIELFKTASCEQCHRLNEVGGTLGPDLAGVAGRNSRVVILREIIEPSKKIPELYQSHIILTLAGKSHQGLVVRQDAKFIYLADDPNHPDQLLKIPRDEVEEKTVSTVSIMPEDLLNTLTKEEILDLLAYIESGGREDHPAFDPVGEHR